MRKTTKSLLLSSLFLFCTGLLLTLGSFLFVKIMNIDPYGMTEKDVIIESKDVSLSEILAQSPNSNFVKKLSLAEFSKIDLMSFTGDIAIVSTAEETHLSLNKADVNNLSYEIIGDTLTVKDVDPVGSFGVFISQEGFSFKGLRQIFGSGISTNRGKTVTLYVNEKTLLSQVNVTTKIGNVSLDGISSDNISAICTNGDVSIANLTNAACKITAVTDSGDISISDAKFSNLSASIKLGSIYARLCDNETQSVVLDALCGSVLVECNAPTSYYKLSLSTKMGGIERNGESIGKELNFPSHTQSRISSTLIVGDITITYLGESEEAYVPSVTEPETEEAESTETDRENQTAEENTTQESAA